MVSYAQNAEDVVLRRVFAELEGGFYVDVGACAPVEDSVTFHFYQEGWSGVNIEPDARYYHELAEARTRDVNLNAAVGVGEGLVTFHPSDVRGQGTLDPRLAAAASGIPPVLVSQISLAEVFSEYAPPGGVDFLKVDVEGWEAEVLASAAWGDVRPRIIVVEAVDHTGAPMHEAWDQTLVGAGYCFGLFDGLNRFYCRDEDANRLLSRLNAPANVFDNWRPAREVRVQQTLDAKLAEAEASHAAARTALEAEQAAHVATTTTLAAVHASTSWRITAPLRDASRLARLMRRGTSP
jgi:FkbM family methyltransferase